MNMYVGRAELLSKKILLKLINCVGIEGQVNIKDIILPEDYKILDQEIKNHNFDLVIRRTNKPDIIVEINYKHKEKAARKWSQIFVPLIKNAGYLHLTINDWDCKSLFYLDGMGEHTTSWGDYIDVIDSLSVCGIKPF